MGLLNKRGADKSSLGLSLRGNSFHRGIAIGAIVFVLCLGTGILSGTIFRKSEEDTFAASASITVLDNDQVVDTDQSTGATTIRKTSTVNVKDPAADKGYVLTAKLAQTDLAGITTTIHSTSPASIHCTETNPCPVTSDKPISVLYPVHNANATTPQGETTTLNITMIIPAGTSIGNYLLDIEYQEEPVIPIQDVDSTTCTTARSIAYDARNSEIYYIQKIEGTGAGGTDLCWMESNLRYAGDGAWDSSWHYPDDRYATTATNTTVTTNDDTYPLTTVSGTQSSSYTVAQIADPNGSTDYTNTAAAGSFYGYLYNWCASMGGQTTACQSSTATQPDPSTSICPAGWRLPTSNTTGEFQAMTAAINATSDAAGSTNLRNQFLAVYSGEYNSGLYGQGGTEDGGWWSSTVLDATVAYNLGFTASGVNPASLYSKYYSFAVRCVKDVTPIKTLSDITYLQDLALAENASVCANTPDRTRVTLKDRRNGQDYYVEKISNLCWMESNLRYAGDGDWNAGWNYPDDRYATTASNATANPNDNTYPLITAIPYTTVSSYTAAQLVSSDDIGGSADYTNTAPNGNSRFYGYLYNWCAATGGQTTACQSSTATQPDPSQSICPAGWRLPTGNTTGEFQALANTIGAATNDTAGSTNLRNQFLAAYSGFYDSAMEGGGTNGHLWSSTVSSSADSAHSLNFSNSGVAPASDYTKKRGTAVRCVR